MFYETNEYSLHVKVRLVAILEEHKLRRAQRDEDRRRSRVKVNATSSTLGGIEPQFLYFSD